MVRTECVTKKALLKNEIDVSEADAAVGSFCTAFFYVKTQILNVLNWG